MQSLIDIPSNEIKLKVFVINLEKDVEKKKHMEFQLSAYQLGAEFIPATDGQKLSEAEAIAFIDLRLKKSGFKRALSKPEIGCFMSHQSIYERIIREGIACSLILEDDIEFVEGFKDVLNTIFKQNQKNHWDILLLGSHHEFDRYEDVILTLRHKTLINFRHRIGRPAELAMGAYAYLLTLNGAKRMLGLCHKYSCPLDLLTGDTNFSGCYVLNPSAVQVNQQLLAMSNLEPSRMAAPDRFRLRKRLAITLGLQSTYYQIIRFIRIAKRLFSISNQTR